MTVSDQRLEAATRAFLRVIKPAWADGLMEKLNCVDLDDTDYEIVDAMRAALEAADKITIG